MTIERIARATFESGYPLTLGGAACGLLYTQNFAENDRGEFGGFVDSRSVTFLCPRGGGFNGFHFFEKDIPSDRILVATPEVNNSKEDSSAPGAVSLGLRLNERRELEIYFPAVPRTPAVRLP